MVKTHKAIWLLRYWTSGGRRQTTVIPERRKTQEANPTVPACCLGQSLQATRSPGRENPSEARQLPRAGRPSLADWGSVMTRVFGEDYWRGENSRSTELWRPAVRAPEASAQNPSAPVCEETAYPRTVKAHLIDQLQQSLRLTQVK